MKAFVFTDESLRAEAGRFVWLAVDTEKETNAPVVEKFPLDAWPTFFVVDPATERVALRWVGAATVPQLQRILDDGAAAVAGTAAKSDAESAFARAERHYAAREFPAAAKAYQEAIAAAPPAWPGYFRAVESLLFSFAKQGDCASALRVAGEALPRLRQAPSAITVAATGLDCALDLPETDPARKDAVALFETASREILADPKVVAAADDRSSLYGTLVGARRAEKDEAGARATAAEWARFLEDQAAKAPTPEARTVFDSHLLSAYLEMGEPQRAIPMLERSERGFPADYNPPARLAVVYKELRRWDEALAATDRALARAYGPRTLRILVTRADVLGARGDGKGARETLERALAMAEGLPPGQRSERTIAALRKRLGASKS